MSPTAPPSPARKARLRPAIACLLTLTMLPVAFFGTLLAWDGGYRGLLMLGSLPLIASGASILAFRSWRDLRTSRLGRWLIAIVLLINLPTVVYFISKGIENQITTPLQRLAPGRSPSPFSRTRIIVRWKDQALQISDPFNQLCLRFGSPPASVEIQGDTRVIVFDHPACLLSWRETIGIEDEGHIKMGGFMGAELSASDAPFRVDRNGSIQWGPQL